MPLSDDELHKVELHVEHAQRAADVLSTVRSVHAESQALRAENVRLASQVGELVGIIGQAGQILRAIDGIYKSPGVTVQRNYEDFLQPELRQLHDRFMRGVI